MTIRDRAFTDCDFDSGQIIFDDALKDGKKLKELAPRPPPAKKELPRALPSPELAPIPPLRYAAPPKEKTTVNYAHLRTKQGHTQSKLQLARGGQGPLLRTDQWQSGFLERLAQKNAVTLHDGRAKQEATQYAKEVGRAIAYWSTGSKAWRFGRVRGLLNDADREEEIQQMGADGTKTGEDRARKYLDGPCVWLEFCDGVDVCMAAVPVAGLVTSATCARKKRTCFFLDFDPIPEGAMPSKRFHLASLDEDEQGWAQCERCFSWRKLEDDAYHQLLADGASFVCTGPGGCKTPFDPHEARFAPLDAPGRQNKRMTRKKK